MAAPQLLRLPQVMARVGLRRASIYRYMDAGKFPRPVTVGERVVCWIDTEIDEWINARITERDVRAKV